MKTKYRRYAAILTLTLLAACTRVEYNNGLDTLTDSGLLLNVYLLNSDDTNPVTPNSDENCQLGTSQLGQCKL